MLYFFYFYLNVNRTVCTNRGDPDLSDLGLCFLHMSQKTDATLIWINIQDLRFF